MTHAVWPRVIVQSAMSQVARSTSRSLLAWIAILASPGGLIAQDGPLYPAQRLPEAQQPATQAPGTGAIDVGVRGHGTVSRPGAGAIDNGLRQPGSVPQPVADAMSQPDGAIQVLPGDGGQAFDFSHFTPSPPELLRDIDGDRQLDVVELDGGVRIRHGVGDGSFTAAVFTPSLLNTPFTEGKWFDMNADGRLDAVFVSINQLDVMLDQGDGTFVTSAALGVLPISSQTEWALGYLDGDGLPDLVVGTQDSTQGPWAIRSLSGLGGTSFAAPELVWPLSGLVVALGVGVLDGDGLADVAVAYVPPSAFPQYEILRQIAPAVYTFQDDVSALTGVRRLVIRDMTGDGAPDVISIMSSTTSLLVNDGTGDFAPLEQLIPGAGAETSFIDVDDDGLVDVLTNFSFQSFRRPSVVLARPDGSLADPRLTPHLASARAAGDTDGDGRLDLLTEDSILFGTGDGRFEVPRAFSEGLEASGGTQIALADFNEDGRPDVATIAANLSGFVAVSMSDVGAAWDPPEYLLTDSGWAIAAADLDGDGHLDLSTSRNVGTFVDMWPGNGDGTFGTRVELPMGGLLGSIEIAWGHFDGNGVLDLVTGALDLRVRLGLGNFTYGPNKTVAPPAGASASRWLATHDLDGDGLDDVLVAWPALHLHRAVGHGNFAPPVLIDAAADRAELLHIDADGDIDLLVLDDTAVRAYLGGGDGSFSLLPGGTVTSDRDVLSADVADANADGLPDLALGHESEWSLHLGLPGSGFEPDPVGVFDLTSGAARVRFEDANEDGRPDLLAVGGEEWELGIALVPHRGGPWTDRGFPLTGTPGDPFLFPMGSLQPNTPVSFELRDALPLAPAHIVVGIDDLLAAFKGGVLVPDPLLIVSGLPISGRGTLLFGGTWPAGVPAGTRLLLQVWIQDGAGPAGFSASNAVEGVAP